MARGAQHPLLVGDMPFMSYQADVKEAVHNAGRFLKEGNMDVVKLEGGANMAPVAKAIVDAGIPVMGHVGLTPQTVSKLGGFKGQGKDAAAQQVIDDALAMMAAAVSEAVDVAQAKGITLPYDNPQARVEEVATATGSNRSSMLSDVSRGAPTEIDVINGAIVREGAKLGIPSPVNQTLVWLVKAIEATCSER